MSFSCTLNFAIHYFEHDYNKSSKIISIHINICDVNYERCALWTTINVGPAPLPSDKSIGGGSCLMFGTLTFVLSIVSSDSVYSNKQPII